LAGRRQLHDYWNINKFKKISSKGKEEGRKRTKRRRWNKLEKQGNYKRGRHKEGNKDK
jgi:hypothetical protein